MNSYPSQPRAFGWIAVWVLALILLFGSIGIGLWVFGVFTADIRGAGNAIKQRQSAVNRIQKQELFEQLAADYEGYLSKIAIAEGALTQAAKTGDSVNAGLRQTELLGLRQTCVDAAQQFNAESRKYTARIWKSAGLPLTLDPADCR